MEMIFRKLIISQERLPIHIQNRFRITAIQEAVCSRLVYTLYLPMYRWADRQVPHLMEDMRIHLLQMVFRRLQARM